MKKNQNTLDVVDGSAYIYTIKTVSANLSEKDLTCNPYTLKIPLDLLSEQVSLVFFLTN